MKEVKQIVPDSYACTCPYCGETTYLGDQDPRGEVRECEECNSDFQVTNDACVVDYH